MSAQGPALAAEPRTNETAGALDGLVELARRLLEAPADRGGFERVARLRDEIHLFTNQVDEFTFDDPPTFVRLGASMAGTAVLAPSSLVHELEVGASRLRELTAGLAPDDWNRVGRLGTRRTTLAAHLDVLLRSATDELTHLLDEVQAEPRLPPAPGRLRAPRRPTTAGNRRRPDAPSRSTATPTRDRGRRVGRGRRGTSV